MKPTTTHTTKQKTILKIDCMIGERFIHTFRLPLKYPKQQIYSDEIISFVESRMPSLKGKDYQLFPYV